MNSVLIHDSLIFPGGRNARLKSVFCRTIRVENRDLGKVEQRANYFSANVEIHRKDVNAFMKNHQVLEHCTEYFHVFMNHE